MEQPPLQTSPQAIVRSGMPYVPVVLAALVGALVSGGAVYAVLQRSANASKEDMQAQIDSLKSEVASTASKSTTPTAQPSPAPTPLPAPSPAPTPPSQAEETKEYSSQPDGFKFSYLKDWKLEDASGADYPDSAVTLTLQKPDATYTEPDVIVEAVDLTHANAANLDTYVKKQGQDAGGAMYSTVATTVNGAVGYKGWMGGNDRREIVLLPGSKDANLIYKLTFSVSPTAQDVLSQGQKTILESFARTK